ncbi:MAG: hypothetical protein Q4A67_02070 [Aerococcus sp.]|nr:hypothetical protein [Aerococcus sp.]
MLKPALYGALIFTGAASVVMAIFELFSHFTTMSSGAVIIILVLFVVSFIAKLIKFKLKGVPDDYTKF